MGGFKTVIFLTVSLLATTWAGPLLSPSFGGDELSITPTEQKSTLSRYRPKAGLVHTITDFNANATITCTACKAAAEALNFFLSEDYEEPELLEFIFSICTGFNIMSEAICKGFTYNMGPQVVEVVNRTTLTPEQLCSFLVGDNCGEVENPGNDWEVVLPPVTKPPVRIPTFPPVGTETLKVLHISDTHVDLHYLEGSAAECSDPLCCREQSGPPAEGSKLAGKWGEFKCDIPLQTLESMLQHAAETHTDLDYIIWTGDLPSHDIWDQTKEGMLEILKITASKLKEAFPDTPIYPAIGNHDSAPVNSFPQPEVGGIWNISWLYDELINEWGSEYLNTNDNNQTIRKGAFYSTLPRPGLRLISLNMNYCYLSNWWLIVNSTDPAQELSWLAEELQKAEYAGEKVHILGHIPPGHSDCLPAWSKSYLKLIARYENTVVAQFFGHTHKDEFEVYYDPDDPSRPVSVSYIGPSVTSFTDLNPGYRVYSVDGDRTYSTRLVVDHETWYFDLDEANKSGEPVWKKGYEVKDEYEMKSLLPSDWDQIFRRLTTDEDFFKLYFTHYSKQSSGMSKCSEDCKRGMLCAIRSCHLYPDIELN